VTRIAEASRHRDPEELPVDDCQDALPGVIHLPAELGDALVFTEDR
jgi:hypothetical protein